jgi:hypothetical protein
VNRDELFNENFRSVSGLLPDARYFQEYANLESDISFSLAHGGSQFLIPSEKVGDVGIIYPRIFAADFYTNAEGSFTSNDYHKILIEVEKKFRSQGLKKIQFRALPNYVTDTHSSWLADYKIQEIKTSVVNLENYEVSARRRRNIRKGSRLRFTPAEKDPLKIAEGWSEMLNFLQSRSLIGLSIERVKYLVITFPEHFSIATVSDEYSDIKALALVNRIGNCMRLPNYFSKTENPGAIDYLINSLIEFARTNGMVTVDLGVSTDPNTNVEVDGIIQFKSEFGAHREIIRRYSKELN